VCLVSLVQCCTKKVTSMFNISWQLHGCWNLISDHFVDSTKDLVVPLHGGFVQDEWQTLLWSG
jgi:hypothetical protein